MKNNHIVVSINTIENVRDFVNIVNKNVSNVTVKSGQYMINGKSILGIFSLDLSTPVEVICDDGFDDAVWNELLEFRI